MSLLNGTQHIKKVMDHFEVYTNNGQFVCSGDTFEECSRELIDLIKVELETIT